MYEYEHEVTSGNRLLSVSHSLHLLRIVPAVRRALDEDDHGTGRRMKIQGHARRPLYAYK